MKYHLNYKDFYSELLDESPIVMDSPYNSDNDKYLETSSNRNLTDKLLKSKNHEQLGEIQINGKKFHVYRSSSDENKITSYYFLDEKSGITAAIYRGKRYTHNGKKVIKTATVFQKKEYVGLIRNIIFDYLLLNFDVIETGDVVSELGKKSIEKLIEDAIKKRYNVYSNLRYLNRIDKLDSLDDIKKYFLSGSGENISSFFITKDKL